MFLFTSPKLKNLQATKYSFLLRSLAGFYKVLRTHFRPVSKFSIFSGAEEKSTAEAGNSLLRAGRNILTTARDGSYKRKENRNAKLAFYNIYRNI